MVCNPPAANIRPGGDGVPLGGTIGALVPAYVWLQMDAALEGPIPIKNEDLGG